MVFRFLIMFVSLFYLPNSLAMCQVDGTWYSSSSKECSSKSIKTKPQNTNTSNNNHTRTKSGFVHPMNFNGSEKQRKQVINFIEARVRHDYCNSRVDMCQNTTLRMMEKANLEAFKEATQATNRSVMDRVIKDYCQSGVDMCNYKTILMMYKKNLDAGSKSLAW